jgi:hypothetical protein
MKKRGSMVHWLPIQRMHYLYSFVPSKQECHMGGAQLRRFVICKSIESSTFSLQSMFRLC